MGRKKASQASLAGKNLPLNVRAWLVDSLPDDVAGKLRRIARARGVRRVAVMPDVHLAESICIGTVVGTENVLYPDAVGGDIGCGVAALQFNAPASLLDDRQVVACIFEELRRSVPGLKHRADALPEIPDDLARRTLSDISLEKLKHRDGLYEFATLGRGNHFIEFQAGDDGSLWLMLHSGSRAMGQAIRAFHLLRTEQLGARLTAIDADSGAGKAYLNDVAWARDYACASRRSMGSRVAHMMQESFGIDIVDASWIECDHNHVQLEFHGAEWLWVHRKGAIHAELDKPGVIPGSMGSPSYHVAGRGNLDALCSCSHGAGRVMTRTRARHEISVREFRRQIGDVRIDTGAETHLVDEPPGAYRDITKVMRAQRDLTRIIRVLHPLLSYKAL